MKIGFLHLINNSMPDLYVFTRALDNVGHSFMTLFRATLRLRELKALVASTVRKAGPVKMDLATWTAASHPLVWPAQSCCDPTVSKMSKMSKERTEAMALQMIRHAPSPMPI